MVADMFYVQNTVLTVAVMELALTAVLIYLFWNRNLQRRFPAMGAYLGLGLVSALVSLANIVTPNWLFFSGFDFSVDIFKAIFLLDTILLYFICMEVFRSALSPFTGLMKFGTIVFRWVVLVSVIVDLSTIHISRSMLVSTAGFTHIAHNVTLGLAHSLSILALCLLGFLCLSMKPLRLSVRDAAFGISLGFGVLSASGFVGSLIAMVFPSMAAPIQSGTAIVLLIVGCLWVAYFALPEPIRKPMLVPVNSTIYRWNEIASALGHTGTKVVVRQPANGFFLSDVERVVETVLARNLTNNESE